MEYYDKVDENDNVVGQTYKEEAHANGLIHRLVAIYVFDTQGRLYLQKHEKSKKWDNSVGGHVSKGETYDEAAEREAYEELQITDPLERISHFRSHETSRGNNYHHFFMLYECHPSKEWKFQPNDEVKVIVPTPLDEIVSMMNAEPMTFTLGFLNTMKEYIKVKNLSFKLSY